MSERTPTIYSLLSQEQKDHVSAAMKEYNGTSLNEVFTNPEDFFQKVYRGTKTLYPHVRRAV